MKNNVILGLSVAGLIFSGYLTGVKLFTDTCALGESCPYFIGYPACYFGFSMYLALFVLALMVRKGGAFGRRALRVICCVSALGILFAGYYTASELPRISVEGFSAYLLGLPTCAYGLIVYLAIFGVSAKALLEKSDGGGLAETSSRVV